LPSIVATSTAAAWPLLDRLDGVLDRGDAQVPGEVVQGPGGHDDQGQVVGQRLLRRAVDRSVAAGDADGAAFGRCHLQRLLHAEVLTSLDDPGGLVGGERPEPGGPHGHRRTHQRPGEDVGRIVDAGIDPGGGHRRGGDAERRSQGGRLQGRAGGEGERRRRMAGGERGGPAAAVERRRQPPVGLGSPAAGNHLQGSVDEGRCQPQRHDAAQGRPASEAAAGHGHQGGDPQPQQGAVSSPAERDQRLVEPARPQGRRLAGQGVVKLAQRGDRVHVGPSFPSLLCSACARPIWRGRR
jgi:hypothetical protein